MLDAPVNTVGDQVDCIRQFATDVRDTQVKVERANRNTEMADAEGDKCFNPTEPLLHLFLYTYHCIRVQLRAVAYETTRNRQSFCLPASLLHVHRV